MKKFIKEYPPVEVEQLRLLRGHNYVALSRGASKIPSCSGIYIWRYWPTVRGLEFDDLISLFEKVQKEFPRQSELLRNSRIEAKILRTPFGSDSQDRVMGKNQGHDKILNLLSSIKESRENRVAIANLIECLLAQAAPIYIGKADNLKNRLVQHFEGKTDFSQRLRKTSISVEDIYISYIKDEISILDESITTTLEEILQRVTNPPLVSRYG